MLYINKITNAPSQKMNLTGLPNITIEMSLRFMPRVQKWIMGVSWSDFSVQGIAVVTSLNMLNQFRNKIPFGITCYTSSGLDPFSVDDFVAQSSNLYLLDAADVITINNQLIA